jgi:hypothetical protein
MDSARAFEIKYNKNGWPFLMLVDSAGQVVYKCTNLVDSDKEFMRQLQNISKTPATAKTSIADGIPYVTTTLRRSNEVDKTRKNERFTSIACGKNGTIYTVFTSVENGNSNVLMKVYSDTNSVRDIPVAATTADEYDGTVMVDGNDQVWICWTSNAIGNKYQIYITSLKSVEDGQKGMNVSKSTDDAMHGRMTGDDSGNIWITYYKWQNIGNASRDKEVYLQKYSNGRFSKEIRVSPSDVPDYEDHTDPAISKIGDDVIIAWSWDYHQPKGYTKEASEPTIFARSVNRESLPGNIFNISGRRIDAAPVLSEATGDCLWCAWDSLGDRQNERGYCKALFVRQLDSSRTVGKESAVAEDLVNVCSPGFAFYKNLKGVLVFSQTLNGSDWSLWKADYDPENKSWKKPAPLISEGNPRFGSCVYDHQGQLWIAYSVQTDNGREVTVKRLD